MDAALIQSAIAFRLPERTRWLIDGTLGDYSFYSVPRNLTAVMAEWKCDLSDVEQVPDFIVFGEGDYTEGGGALTLLVVRQSDGRVFDVDVEAYEPLHLLNSSLEAFIDTFCLLDKYLGQGQPVPTDLNSLLRNIDPTVYSQSHWGGLVDLVASRRT